MDPRAPLPYRRSTRLAPPVLVALLAILVALPSAAPARAADPSPTPTPVPLPSGVTRVVDGLTFHGRGYGHGVGMSQHGARGRATAGHSAGQILAHYFQGTTIGTIPTDTPIRVRVLKDFAASSTKPLVLYGRGGAWTIDGVTGTFPADAKITITPRMTSVDGKTTTTWRLRVTDTSGAVLRDAATSHLRFRPAATATKLQVWSRPSSYDTYRGVIRAVLSTTSTRANVVNELRLEDYLRGVVPAEMPSSWPTAALRAQAIAARSYAARRLRPGVSWYDVADDTTSQVYLGLEGEKPATDAAIAGTAGKVVLDGSTIANTMFHSASGGWTEHNENVYVSATGAKVAGPVPYLRGVSDRRSDGTSFDGTSPYATWQTRAYSRAQLTAIFAADGRTDVGVLAGLDLRKRGVSKRLIAVTLYGSEGTRTVSGDVFRSVFNTHRPTGDPSMRSTLVDTQPVP